jgi:hypothetical protein
MTKAAGALFGGVAEKCAPPAAGAACFAGAARVPHDHRNVIENACGSRLLAV